MSFLKRLFGGGAPAREAPRADPVEHRGFMIVPTPYEVDGQWQVCGEISREADGETQNHRFIRADRASSREDAVEMTLRKARQTIDQMGERIFG
jgi:hypothetical protein